ncbi:hypothetical protein GCM10027343_42810 [Noviherbaspirillum agri]
MLNVNKARSVASRNAYQNGELPNSEMNKSQYKRLCLVLVVPLLFAGFISSNTFLRFEKYNWLLCEKYSERPEYCRGGSFKDHTTFYESIKKTSPAWFEVIFPPNEKPVKFDVMARVRLALADEIIDAKPHLGYEDKADYMNQMIGRNAEISLGIIEDAKSHIDAWLPFVFLACNRLEMDNKEPRVYTAHCVGKGWNGAITFKASADTEVMLQELKNAYYKELDELEFSYWANQITAWLLYVVLFLIISLIVYLIRISINYVRFGSKKRGSSTEAAGT